MKNHQLSLRKRAEKFLTNNSQAFNKPEYDNQFNLIEELHIHQIELEMQNEELQRTHLELAAVRDKYVNLYDFAPVGYVTLSEKGLILNANLTISTMLGIEKKLLIGKPFSRFITRDTQDDFYLARNKLFETKVKQTCELKLKKKNNAPFHALLESDLVKDFVENTVQVLTVINDISERKRTEEALRESRERYRLIFENIQDVYYEVSLDGIILEISPSIEEVSRYSRDELIGTTVYNLYVNPEKRNELVQVLLKTGKVTDYEIVLKNKNGLPRYCSLYAKLFHNKNGVPEKIVGSVCDITRRKQAENALRASEAQKTALLDAAIDRIRYVDKDLKIIWANKTAVDASGMTPEDLIGKTCYQVFAGRGMPCERCPTLRAKQSGRIERSLMCRQKAKGISGEGYWDAYCIPLENETGIPESFIQIARNITEQIRAEDQIRTLTQELLKAQESERQMISSELHDRVAQELAAVKINCEMLLNDRPPLHPDIRQKVSEMKQSLQESIKAIRDLSYELLPPVLDDLGLVETLFHYCQDFSENCGIGVDFSAAGMKDLKLDFNTEINLYRLVQEGLTNIKKHADASHVSVRLIAVSPNIILRIEDNGKGFDVQERMSNITKEKRMGIRSMEERVKLLQGKMVIQSKPMRGTMIYIKFPHKD